MGVRSWGKKGVGSWELGDGGRRGLGVRNWGRGERATVYIYLVSESQI
uniref:Uncharacterized protein n=1 Tax=Desertifilum tharense IPPAS B-1220 TaxID=1781255 RepID=A0ACD5GYP9_9CYAN